MDLLKAFHNPDAKVGSSSFDLSCRRIFSSKAGQLVPALVLDTVPGDKFQINLDALMRSNTLDTAAFIRGKFNYDFFFVPYQQCWHRFLEFVNQKVDLHTSSYNGRTAVAVPTIKLRDLIKMFGSALVAEYTHDQIDFTPLNDLGWTCFGVDDQGQQFTPEDSYIADSIKLLNMLGYGDFSGIFDFINEDDLNDVADDTGNYRHWLDALCGDGSTINPFIYINPLRLCAYQHIWYDIYRNKFFDVPSNNNEMEDAFNLDNQNCTSIASSRMIVSSKPERFLRMTMLHYCQWKKDIYTSLVPSQQFGVVSSVDVSFSGIESNFSSGRHILSFESPAGNLNASTSVSDGQAPQYYNGYAATIRSSFDVLTLRRAEAMQKWKEAAIRAGNNSNDNQRAHFGVDPYYYEDNEVHFLGSYDGVFQVNPVAASSAASSGLPNNNVGDLAATGTSVVTNGRNIQFDCRDYGVLMCISRFVPESEYSATGIEKSNTRFEPFDYYNPEFAHLGLQAVPLIEQENSPVFNDANGKNFVLGYAPRDYDYKQMQDKVYGGFMNISDSPVSRSYGVFSNWVAPRCEKLVSIDQGVPNGRSISSFYVDPAVFDRVFLIKSNGFDSTDQFLHQCYFNVKSIRKMPVLGLPEF